MRYSSPNARWIALADGARLERQAMSTRLVTLLLLLVPYGQPLVTPTSLGLNERGDVTDALASPRPALCVAVLSYQRLDLLNRTLSAVLSHLHRNEPTIPFEVAWVDNGSDDQMGLLDIAKRSVLPQRITGTQGPVPAVVRLSRRTPYPAPLCVDTLQCLRTRCSSQKITASPMA